MKKKFMVLMLCFFVLFANISSVQAKSNATDKVVSSDKKNITDTIQSFFKSYENAFDNEDTEFKDIYNHFSNDYKNIKITTLIKTILKRRIILSQEYPNKKLKELNKQLKFDYDSININNNSAIVTVTVTKMFNYNISLDTKSASSDKYSITLKKDTNWRICSVDGFVDNDVKEDFSGKGIDSNNVEDLTKYQNNLRQDVIKFYDSFKSEMTNNTVASNSNILAANVATASLTTLSTYNRIGATNYATQYAISPNTNYVDFGSTGTNEGGDCTNFISQCLNEGGGISEHFGTIYSNTCWFYTTGSNRSSSWTGAQEFNTYVKSSVSKINSTMSTFSSVDYGDIIQLQSTTSTQMSHSLIITGIVMSSYGRSDLLFCCHSSNKLNYSLSNTYGSRTKQYIHILGCK